VVLNLEAFIDGTEPAPSRPSGILMIRIRAALFWAVSMSLVSPALAASKGAKQAPVCAPTPTPTSSAGGRERRLSGIVATVYGQNDIALRGDDGNVVEVQLTINTIVTPLGMHVQVGRRVNALGHLVGCTFVARKIVISYY
jgi:hypothetical protein